VHLSQSDAPPARLPPSQLSDPCSKVGILIADPDFNATSRLPVSQLFDEFNSSSGIESAGRDGLGVSPLPFAPTDCLCDSRLRNDDHNEQPREDLPMLIKKQAQPLGAMGEPNGSFGVEPIKAPGAV
jgi:hypothetical protein